MIKFLENKYTKWYYNIINKAILENRRKCIEIYFENHHIIPKSCGGLNKNNLVLLTAKEHLIVHMLLVKMVEDQYKYKLAFALNRMNNSKSDLVKRPYTSSQYELSKKLNSKYISQFHLGREAWNKGKSPTLITKQKISNNLKGKKFKNKAYDKGNRYWVTNGSKNIMIKINEIIPDTFYKGRTYKSKRMYFSISDEMKIQISNNLKSNPLSSKNTIWINNGIKNKRIKSSEVPEGWIKGMI